jgi:hypothetical protein
MPALQHLKVIGPASEKCAVALPVRKPNAAYRSRERLSEREVEKLIDAAKDNRWGHRDATMVLLAFRARSAGFGTGGPSRRSCTFGESNRALRPRIR